ncbi:hypothetical protein GWO43_22430 [candidate division KSB1 bacterium]|nr:hypothetical protein [candidate division KSB1 bacterium]NIR72703.1 hypothetical protein [candidate division KSB1 bacterium]NIT73582.1 hypothetical protein [candidate division KSB1 bacterium]NIU27458.1 hypothetical protein [candidate division KSB1 bacterium]NIV96676.1 hypothetical protein [candidate division KSB1 bacterium]
MVNQRLWGLTLLERNLRELEKLSITEITVVTTKEIGPLKRFCHPIPESLNVSVVFETQKPFAKLGNALNQSDNFLLVLEGHAINDRRLLKELISAKSACAVISPSGSRRAGAALLSSSKSSLFKDTNEQSLTAILNAAMQNSTIDSLSLARFENYIENLRREIPPFLFLVETPAQVKEADRILRNTVHKGVLEFVAKYIHPPLEFGSVRMLAHTRVTPNQITVLWLILAGLTIPLFATGHLLLGCILAAVSGVLDGVDGKLARLTLRFSKTGDLLDHIGGTVYDGIWYLALGWYFSVGDLTSTAATFTGVLFLSYMIERIVPGLFKKLHNSEIHDYSDIDVFVRFVGSRMNNNIWVFMIGVIWGLAQETFYAISLWMLATATWHTLRLVYVTAKTRIKSPALAN